MLVVLEVRVQANSYQGKIGNLPQSRTTFLGVSEGSKRSDQRVELNTEKQWQIICTEYCTYIYIY